MDSSFEEKGGLWGLPQRRPALVTGLAYLAFGVVWIAVSDSIVATLADDPQTLTLLQSYKGWAFVVASALLFSFLIGRYASQRDEIDRVRARDKSYYQSLIDHAQEGFWQIDTDARTVQVNRVLANLLGYTPREMLGRTPFEFVDEENRSIFEAQIARAPTTIERSYEITLRTRSGRPLPTLFHATALRDDFGNWQGSYAFVTDVSELKATEDALQRANRAHRTLSGSNRALVHGMHEGDMPRQICQVAVEQGGYDGAWAGLFRRGTLRPGGYYGLDQSEADRLAHLLSDARGSDCVVCTATEKWEPVVYRRSQMAEKDCAACLLSLDARFESLLVLPVHAETTLGLILLFSTESDAFSEDEVDLLSELALDLGFGIDGLRRRQREKEYLRELKLTNAVFETTREGIVVTDSEERIVRVNPAFTRITGYPPEEVVGNTPRLLKSGRHERDFYQAMWTALEQQGHWEGELWNRRKSGEIYPELMSISALPAEDDQVAHYVGVFADISRLRQSESELDFLAHHDPMTRIPNRLLLRERLRHAVEHAKREGLGVAVVCFDLDAFKQVNDGLGHGAGDRLLQEVVRRLQAHLREQDTLARLGGDDFALLLEEVDSTHVPTQIAQKVQDVFREPFLIDDAPLRASVSIGVAVYPQDGTDPEALLRNADTAMHRSKQEGRGGFQFYSEQLTTLASDRLSLENALHDALEREQFHLVYQPQVELATGRITGLEALVRWEHPEQGLIGPDRFIPIAEETGLVVPIDRWVLETACRQAAAWLADGKSVRQVSVNVSGVQVRRTDLIRTVGETLERTGLPAGTLELELTERTIMEDSGGVGKTLAGLRGTGVELAIDDFGTGYSSLSYLRRLPVTKLKIDKAFVDDVPGEPNAEAIVRAVIALGKAMQLKVVAEGVETRNQADFLLAEGCQEGQGYLYSKPLGPEEIGRLLQGGVIE